ncbi:MAG: hypothetical protein FJ255_01330 [Phycisphaerae bacterium]|nr:hypothetical protein [Phycisphaerae bacterium]
MHHPEVARLTRTEATAAAWAQQPAGYTHAWGTRAGTVFNDEGRSVAVTNDGSVVWTGTTLYPDTSSNEEPPVPMSRVSKYPSTGGDPCWTVVFEANTPLHDMVVTRALALADPTLEAPTDGVAYVVGRYKGSVEFFAEGAAPPLSATTEWSYVAKARQTEAGCPPGGGRVRWVTGFSGGRNAALTVATGRPHRNLSCGSDDVSTKVFGSVVVGGFFEGTVWFGGEQRAATSGGEDAYIVLLDTNGLVTGAFRLGGAGNQRITALAIDERTQDLIVAGWFDHPQTNFNLGGGDPIHPPSHGGGRDMFVARYRVPLSGTPMLVWLHVSGTAGDDEASCVALGVNDDANLTTLAFVGGWTAGAGRDLYFAAIQHDGSVKWSFNPSAAGDDRVLSVAVDGLGRPVFTGQFGCPYAPGTPCADPSIAFGSTVLTPDGLDAFAARVHPITGAVEWAYRIGGNLDESATAIAFDPAYTDRFALTGWFGRPDAAPGQYAIDLNPNPTITNLVVSEGFSDAFLAVVRPAAPAGVGFQVSLVLDNSISMFCDPTAYFAPMLACLGDTLARTDVIPSVGSTRPGGGSRLSAVQVNAILHTTRPLLGREARVVMPWTVFDTTTRDLFARKLAALAIFLLGTQTNRVADGLLAARDSLARSGVGSSAHASILLIGNEPGMPDTPAARAAASAPGYFDRICSLGAGAAFRDTMLETVIAPVVPDPQGPEDIDKRSTGIAARTEAIEPPPSLFSDLLARLLQRLCWCPSDFNRDECTDNNAGAEDDWQLWSAARQAQVVYADWNMDGVLDLSVDPFKVERGLEGLPPPPNARVCNTCPQN